MRKIPASSIENSPTHLPPDLEDLAFTLDYPSRIQSCSALFLTPGLSGRREVLFRAVAPELSLCYELGKKWNGSEVNAIYCLHVAIGHPRFQQQL